MKKIVITLIAFVFLSGCNSADNDAAKNSSSTDSTGLTNPSAIDTIRHPSGVDNSSVISTDTTAMNTQNSFKKADSAAKQKNQ